MTQDEIIEMAIQAGFDEHHAKFDTRIKAFATLVAEHEREACAKRLDAVGGGHCADNIRLRGQE